MKTSALFRSAAAVAVATGLFTALPAAAIVPGVLTCKDSVATTSNPGYKICGEFVLVGEMDGQARDVGFVKELYQKVFGPAAAGSDFELVGLSGLLNNPGDPSGPFKADPGGSTKGRLEFDIPVKGFFALGLQSDPSESFSIYLFDATAFGGAASGIEFDALGIGNVNFESDDPTTPVKFAGLFRQVLTGPGAVPEPAGVALTLTALGALALTRRRRG